MAPGVVEAAAGVHMLGDGYVDELAGDLLGAVARERIVALGGGRVVDTAKALAAASGGTQVAMAVPTTLSGAEMTRIHRRARGLRPARADRAPAGGRQRPGAVGLAAARRAGGERAQRAQPRGRGAVHAARQPGGDARRPRRRAAARALAARAARPRGARARRAAGRLRDRLDRLRAAPRPLADAGAAGRRAHGQANAVLLCHTIGALAWRFPRAHRRARRRARGRPRGRRGAHVPARSARRGCATSASSGKCSRSARTRRPSGPSSTSRRRAPTGPSCWHSTRGHGERRTEGRRGEDARRGRARRRDRHLRALLRAARVGRDGDARRRRPRPALRRPVLRRPAGRGGRRGARQGRRDQAQRRARDEHGHGAGEVAARGQGGQDLPRHHRRAGARAAQASTTRGCRSCS